MMRDLSAGLDEVRDALVELVSEIRDEFGSAPSVAEVLEVIALAMPYGDERLEPVTFPMRLWAQGSKVARQDRGASRVSDLNDASFVIAGHAIDLLIGRLAASGEPMTVARLLPPLAGLLRNLSDDALAGAAGLQAIEAKWSPVRGRRPRLGDVVSIPSTLGGWYVAVVVARNRFGTAYGLFQGRQPTLRTPAPGAQVDPYPVYSDDDEVLHGRWPVLGRDEKLLERFPADPEIFHWPGLAETSAGATRPMSDEEAELVGLADRSYRQSWMSEYLAAKLDAKATGDQ
ncbi:hypothetical protein AB0M46_46855 [Dactylosporangium sp. NPDC051485]|uniref:hypothetical protein n=1 Tax=Dactylosporangium sp. NPDC051485 TaxID=3154846 RepID=UPI003429CFED